MFTFAKLIFQVELAVSPEYGLHLALRQHYKDVFQSICNRLGVPETYVRVFGQTLSPDPAAVKRFQKPPLPFVFDLPLTNPDKGSDHIVDIGLVLAGTAVNDLEVFVAAFRETFDRLALRNICQASVIGLTSCAADGSRKELLTPAGSVHPGGLTLLSMDVLPPLYQGDTVGALRVVIQTPLRLIYDGRPVRHLTFQEFIRPLMRRYSSLAYYYGGVESDADYKWLSEESTKVSLAGEALHWTVLPGLQGGVVGEVTFRAVPVDYLLFLQCGEYFHLGKGAAFGMGQYRLRL